MAGLKCRSRSRVTTDMIIKNYFNDVKVIEYPVTYFAALQKRYASSHWVLSLLCLCNLGSRKWRVNISWEVTNYVSYLWLAAFDPLPVTWALDPPHKRGHKCINKIQWHHLWNDKACEWGESSPEMTSRCFAVLFSVNLRVLTILGTQFQKAFER